MKKELILGLDVGTQFCSVGCAEKKEGIDEYVYKQIYFVENNKETDKIPTEICYVYENNKYTKRCGNEVTGQVIGQKFTMGKGCSIKTEIRQGNEQITFKCADDGKVCRKNSAEVLFDFLTYLKGKIDGALVAEYGANGYEIKGIRVAFPDAIDGVKDNSKYSDELLKTVKGVFSCEKAEIKVYVESQLAADLVKKIALKKPVQPGIIIAIDVGAGTTDFSCMYWNSDKNKYEAKWLSSFSDLGGKSFFDAALINPLFREAKSGQQIVFNTDPYEMIKYKRWINGCNDRDSKEIINHTLSDVRGKLGYAFDYGGDNSISKKFRNIIKGHVEKALQENPAANGVMVLLTGGSCGMWLILAEVNNAISELAKTFSYAGRLIGINPMYLNQYAQGTTFESVNNSNFMSRAAACYQLKIADETKTETPYNPFAIAVRYKENKEIGYKVISNRGDVSDKKRYYLSGGYVHAETEKGKRAEFQLKGILFRLEFNKNKNVAAGTFIPDKDKDKFIKGEPKEITDFVGYKETMPEENAYRIGIVFDNVEDMNNNVQVYVYDDKGNSYYDKNKQEDMPLAVMEFACKNK